jgi:hypothetical protein
LDIQPAWPWSFLTLSPALPSINYTDTSCITNDGRKCHVSTFIARVAKPNAANHVHPSGHHQRQLNLLLFLPPPRGPKSYSIKTNRYVHVVDCLPETAEMNTNAQVTFSFIPNRHLKHLRPQLVFSLLADTLSIVAAHSSKSSDTFRPNTVKRAITKVTLLPSSLYFPLTFSFPSSQFTLTHSLHACLPLFFLVLSSSFAVFPLSMNGSLWVVPNDLIYAFSCGEHAAAAQAFVRNTETALRLTYARTTACVSCVVRTWCAANRC